jgi:hypothetical protein
VPIGRSSRRSARSGVARLRDIPNVGPATERDFLRLGITDPSGLAGQDGLRLYRRLCRVDGVRHDPCCADVFLAAVDYMNGAPARPWRDYTGKRKKLMGKNEPPSRARRRPR